MEQDLKALLNECFTTNSLLSGTLSSPRKSTEPLRITIRPLQIKGNLLYQWAEFKNNQVFHRNLTSSECQAALQIAIPHYKQCLLSIAGVDYQILVSKKGAVTILQKSTSKRSAQTLQHNRLKQYLLEEGTPIPFLVELGIMNSQGKVYSDKRDKFRQINRFVEMVKDVLTPLKKLPKVHVVDFGCGKAYLTFALYHYLHVIEGLNLTLVGVDLKTSVLEQCQAIADKLGCHGLHFVQGRIGDYQNKEPVDMVVALHACDTATDDALARAIHWQAKVILCAPCCQHELFQQISNAALEPILKHGILKERVAALVTDAARAQLLEVSGYQTQVIEFIESEHTPKNVLIRGIKKSQGSSSDEAWKKYLSFKESLRINPALERLLFPNR